MALRHLPPRHITNSLISGISGNTHASYASWDEALAAYTAAYNANAVQITNVRSRRSRIRGSTPQPTPQATASAPATPHRPSVRHTHSVTPGGTRSNPHVVTSSSPALHVGSGHPQDPIYVGSSPAPSGTPVRRSGGAAPSHTQSSVNRLRVIEEALSEEAPRTPAPMPDARYRDAIRSRIRALEEALDAYMHRQGASASPQTPSLANSSVEARLNALEANVNHILTSESERQSLRAHQRNTNNLHVDGRDPTTPGLGSPFRDGRDLTPRPAVPALPTTGPSTSSRGLVTPGLASRFLDGRDLTPRLATPALPTAGSSTGPGTLAGEVARLRSPLAIAGEAARTRAAAAAAMANSNDDEYPFDVYTEEEDAQVTEFLLALHENFLANKKSPQ